VEFRAYYIKTKINHFISQSYVLQLTLTKKKSDETADYISILHNDLKKKHGS